MPPGDMDLSSWAYNIKPNLWFAGMPKEDYDLSSFDLIVSLSDFLPPQAAERYHWDAAVKAQGVMFLHWPIIDGGLPSLERLGFVTDTIVSMISREKKVFVHCHEGRNRTGLILAVTLMKLDNLSGAEAVKVVTGSRPGMLYNRVFKEWLESLPEGCSFRS